MKTRKGARKLVQTGFAPAWGYAAHSLGQTPAQLHKYRATALMAAGMPTKTHCPTVAWQVLWKQQDPTIAEPVAQVMLWLKAMREIPKFRKQLGTAWEKKHLKALFKAKTTHRWMKAAGPTGAALASMLDAGWKPGRPGTMTDKEQHTWQVPQSTLHDERQLEQALKRDIEVQQLTKAAN